jgi:hypothetical protein
MTFCAKGNLTLAVLVLTSAAVWAKPNVSDLAYKCNSLGKQKACRELAKLAERDKDTSVRIQAIGQLTDESVLTRVVAHELFPAVRQAAEARLRAIHSAKTSP